MVEDQTSAPDKDIQYDEYAQGAILAGHYKIIHLIGKGGLGAVYQAQDMELNETLAVKIFHPNLTESPDMVRRFREKIKKIRKITSSGIVDLHTFGTDRGNYYLVMELVRGKNLEDLLGGKPIGKKKAQAIVMTLCDHLKPVHEAGLIHGNLKPRNIIISKTGAIKIIDFGFTSPEDISNYPGLFDARYMAPEQLYPLDPAPAIDIYSLGIVFYQMLTGSVPFNSTEPSQLALEHAKMTPKPPSEINKSLDKDIDVLMAKVLDKNPQRRFNSVEQMKAVLIGNMVICPRCKKAYPIHQQCPDCREYGELISDARSMKTKKVVESKVQQHEATLYLFKIKNKKKKRLEHHYDGNCSYCGKSMPTGFPFCPKCELENPFKEQLETDNLLVLESDGTDRQKNLLRLLQRLATGKDFPSQLRDTTTFPFMVHIKDLPNRAGELVEEFKSMGVYSRPIDPDSMDEKVRLNSWTLPIIGGIATFVGFFFNAFIGIPLLCGTAFLIFRNLNTIHIPLVIVHMSKMPGLLSSQIINDSKRISSSIRPYALLTSIYETNLFVAFRLMEMMRRSRDTETVFTDIINSVEQLLFQAGKNVESIMYLEKNYLTASELDLKKEIHYIEQKMKENWPVQQMEEFQQRHSATKERLKNYYEMTEKLTDHYNSLLDILKSLHKMTPKISNIVSEMSTYGISRKREEKALIQEVLTDLTALEAGFKELDE